eukprot:gene4270-4522_t
MLQRAGITWLLVVLGLFVVANGQISQIKLPYKLDSIEPAIDTKTMTFHYGTHYATYVNNTNAALANATSLSNKSNLTSLIIRTSSLPGPLNTTIRNQGGGAWNHALYFRHLTNPKLSSTSKASAALTNAVKASFGSWDNLTADLTTASTKVFGSGWAWLCYNTGAPPVKYAGCTPILGVDVWEHAYYLKHGPKRAAYIKDFFTAVDWAQVSKNYDNAKAGKAEDMVKP